MKDLKKIIKSIPQNFRIVANTPFKLSGSLELYAITYSVDSEKYEGFIFRKVKGSRRLDCNREDQQSIHEFQNYFMIIEPSRAKMKNIKEIENFLSKCELNPINDLWCGLYRDDILIGKIQRKVIIHLIKLK
jgi:hypothetical protein